MLSSLVHVGLALTLAGPALAGPLEARQVGKCTGQSCIIAAISGSSGQPIDQSHPPTGDTIQGDCCVVSYRPEIRSLVEKFRPEVKTACPAGASATPAAKRALTPREEQYKRDVESMSRSLTTDEVALAAVELTKRAACLPKTLVYSKGTFEPGELGVTLGPKLNKALQSLAPNTWSVQGVDYQPSVAGDNCLGLPGGVAAKQLLAKVAAQCPQTKLFTAGYSQGAMVVRDGLGNSTLGSRVKGVLTFGDPFNGAPIKGYSGPIRTYCASGDGVCSGMFQISGAHLSYGGDVNEAAAFLNNL